jgi:UTP--glucose-1-phosphate uridylyltransferase
MLPVVDTPTIHYVVDEAVTAGISDLLLVTGRGKRAIEDYFDRNTELEDALAAKGDEAGLAVVQASNDMAAMHYIRQGEARGLGHAVFCAAEHVGNEPFAVLLGDDFIHPDDLLLQRMIEVRQRYGGSVVALMEVEPEQVSSYGVVAFKPTDEDDVVAVTDMVEKPPVGDAPSNWIIIGRYVCDPAVFDVLRETPPGRGNEIQLTDALKTLAQMPGSEGGGVRGVQFRGRRFDTGNPVDYLRTIIQFALERQDVATEFLPWLRKYLDDLP